MLRLAGSARFSRCNPKRSFLRQDRADGRIVRIMAKFPSASVSGTGLRLPRSRERPSLRHQTLAGRLEAMGGLRIARMR